MSNILKQTLFDSTSARVNNFNIINNINFMHENASALRQNIHLVNAKEDNC